MLVQRYPDLSGMARFSALQRAENSSIAAAPQHPTHRSGFQCSSASRKFLNDCDVACRRCRLLFQCSSASRKFLNLWALPAALVQLGFSALQRAENSSIRVRRRFRLQSRFVSVLFSEPKIPQCVLDDRQRHAVNRFSALQRAENSSIVVRAQHITPGMLFQCSSASRKFLNLRSRSPSPSAGPVSVLFSEPKIPQFSASGRARYSAPEFQCSSASRKFLNMPLRRQTNRRHADVSVLFSEPKIPQWRGRRAVNVSGKSFSALQRAENSSILAVNARAVFGSGVSVLFSEPKIPQYAAASPDEPPPRRRFSALQRAENSSIKSVKALDETTGAFQCSSASRKFLN